MTGEYATIQFFADDSYERVVEWVDAAEAVSVAKRLTDSIGARLGMTQRVIVTDGGDFTCFQWEYGKGVTYPPWDAEEGRYVAG